VKRVHTLGLLAALALTATAVAQTGTTTTTPTAPASTAPRPAASSYIALGNAYYAKGQFDSAYVAFRAAVESDPRSSDALLGLGRAQTKLKLYSAAIETLKRLIQADSRNVSGYIALAQTYVSQYLGTSDRTAVRANLDEALRILTDAETIKPDAAGIWNQRSIVYRLKGDFQRATDTAKRAAELDPNDSVILYNLGDLYYATGNTPLAVETIQRAVVANPTDAYTRAYYGKLLMIAGKPEAAQLELAQAERLAPTNAYAVGQYGVYAYQMKDTVTARAKLSQAIKLDPLRYPEFYFYLGRIEFDAGQTKEARSSFTKAAALGSNNADYFYWLGRAQEASGDRLAARQAYQQAVTLNPNLKVAQDGLNRVK